MMSPSVKQSSLEKMGEKWAAQLLIEMQVGNAIPFSKSSETKTSSN